ncbi:IS3 family transposase, partial [Escherichia coli]|uniref:IS3 family transposase n=1 Tax=Escherichia coli TaxID=562 RepID=UPI00201AEDFB
LFFFFQAESGIRVSSTSRWLGDLYNNQHFISREIMRATVFNYIECDYNRWRRHSWCGGLSPEQFENQNLA